MSKALQIDAALLERMGFGGAPDPKVEGLSVDEEIRHTLGERFDALSEDDLSELRVTVTKRRKLRGTEKLQARLYRISHKAQSKLSKIKWKRTAAAKKLARAWKKLKARGGGMLARLKKRFGKRTMVRIAASFEPETDGAGLAEAVSLAMTGTPGQPVERAEERVVGMTLAADIYARIGVRMAEMGDEDGATKLAEHAESCLALAGAAATGSKTVEAIDDEAKKLLQGVTAAYKTYESDEFWESYVERGPFAAALEADDEGEAAED